MGPARMNGHVVTSARVTISEWGVARARVSLGTAPEPALEGGPVELELGGLTLVGTVVPGRGGSYKGAGEYLVAAGAGGWSRDVPEKSYQGPIARLATIVEDAARAAGETVEVASGADRVVGPFMRQQGPASRVLQALAPEAWRVDLDGVTRIGPRSEATIASAPLRYDPARAVAHFALEDLAELVPGATFSLGRASTVVHYLEGSSLRSEVWLAGAGDRGSSSFRGVAREVGASARYFGAYEYRVASQDGDVLELEPTDLGLGLDATKASPRPGIAGARVELEVGSHVLVSFVNGDPARPYVAAFPGTADPGATPARIVLGAADGDSSSPFLRSGDRIALAGVTLGAYSGFIVLDPSVVSPGPPGVGYSRAEG